LANRVGHEPNYRALLDSIRDGLVIIDAAGSCIDANPSFCRILSTSREQLLGLPFKDLLPPETVAESDKLLESLKSLDGIRLEFSLRTSKGTTVLVEWIWSSEYVPGFFLCACAESARTEERSSSPSIHNELDNEVNRGSEIHYRTLAESLPQLVWTALPNGECDYLSTQWERYTGIPVSDQLGFKWLNLVMHPEDLDRTRDAWMTALSGLAAYDLEYRLRRYDGTYRWFKTRGTPVRDWKGLIVKWFGTCTDIDDQKKAAEERQALWVRERAARARAELLNEVGVLINSELDGQKLAQRVTDLATRLLGAEFGSFFHNVVNPVGESYLLYTLSGAPPEAFSKFPMPRNTEVFGPTFRGEGIIRSDDITKDRRYGKNAPYRGMPEGHLPVRSYLAAPVISRLGDVIGGLFFGHPEAGVFTDEHEELIRGLAAHAAIALDNATLFSQLAQEKNRAEAALSALQRANEELRLANADLEQFAYSASHDLQEPLRMVSIYSELLKKRFSEKLGPEGDEFIRYTVEGAIRMEHLVRDLLAYTAASAAVDSPGPPAHVRDAVDNAVGSLRVAIVETRAKITSDNLPTLIGIDGVHLEQVFQNLISNALKYRSAKTPEIHITAELSGNEWLFSVSDNGIGIDPQYKELIFGIFKRLHTSREYSGTGIGLAICQKIVERAGGRIWVESQVGRGANFFFTIPHRKLPDLAAAVV
jgi:PAS domain S-box-containing protein